MNRHEQPRVITGGLWFRFDEYDIVVGKSGSALHIRAAKNQKPRLIRPFDMYPNVFQDYVELGKGFAADVRVPDDIDDNSFDEWQRRRNLRNAQRIVTFAKKYGVPGMLWWCDPVVDLMSGWDDTVHRNVKDDRVFVAGPDPGVGSAFLNPSGIHEAKEFLDWFLTARFSLGAALAYSRPFLKAYGEPVRGVVHDAMRFFDRANEWNRFRDGRFDPGDTYRHESGKTVPGLTWGHRLSQELTAKAVIGVSFKKRQPELQYSFRSLAAALRIMLALNVTSEAAGQTRFCVRCGTSFEARDERSRFCGKACKNASSVRDYRLRKKDDEKARETNGVRATLSTRRKPTGTR